MSLPLHSRLLADVNSSSSSHDPTTQLVDSDFLVILAALLCALICILGLVAVARCAWIRRIPRTSPPGLTPVAATSSSADNKGLNKKVLNSLPKLTYSPAQHRHHHASASAAAAADDDESTGSEQFSVDCAICLAEFVSGEEIRLLPLCRHVFHVGCIDKWLKSHSSCPSCRVKILLHQQSQV